MKKQKQIIISKIIKQIRTKDLLVLYVLGVSLNSLDHGLV